jgi:enamine deaminase RidA (YjgF/YER057c/UK114 family)
VRQAFGNLGVALAAHGLDLSHVVQIRTYVVDHGFDKLGVIGKAMQDGWSATPPTHTVIGVATLATREIQFEVEAVAARP